MASVDSVQGQLAGHVDSVQRLLEFVHRNIGAFKHNLGKPSGFKYFFAHHAMQLTPVAVSQFIQNFERGRFDDNFP
jgi:hypothetical protein